MSVESIKELMVEFEAAKITDAAGEFWSARDLQNLLGYPTWGKFQNVIKRAMDACISSGGSTDIHFAQAGKMNMVGLGNQRQLDDFRLTRWGAYLAAMNGDPRKSRVAFAQVYFVARTQQAEVVEQRMLLHDRVAARKELTLSEKDFSAAMYDSGLDGYAIGRVRSAGDEALFGLKTEDLKRRYGMVNAKGHTLTSSPADRMPAVVARGKAFAASLTTEKIKGGTRGEFRITRAHQDHNSDVRAVIQSRMDVPPEDLPPEEDIKKVERRLQADAERAKIEQEGRAKIADRKDPIPVVDPHDDPGTQLGLPFDS